MGRSILRGAPFSEELIFEHKRNGPDSPTPCATKNRGHVEKGAVVVFSVLSGSVCPDAARSIG